MWLNSIWYWKGDCLYYNLLTRPSCSCINQYLNNFVFLSAAVDTSPPKSMKMHMKGENPTKTAKPAAYMIVILEYDKTQLMCKRKKFSSNRVEWEDTFLLGLTNWGKAILQPWTLNIISLSIINNDTFFHLDYLDKFVSLCDCNPLTNRALNLQLLQVYSWMFC